jgi:hypothetical protein
MISAARRRMLALNVRGVFFQAGKGGFGGSDRPIGLLHADQSTRPTVSAKLDGFSDSA